MTSPGKNLIVGLHGEYLMPLLDFDKHDVEESPHFELVVPNDGGVTGDPVEFTDFNMAEKVFLDEHMAPVETYADGGESKLRRHHLTTFETKLNRPMSPPSFMDFMNPNREFCGKSTVVELAFPRWHNPWA